MSGGATVAAFVAQGLRPSRLYDALMRGDGPLFPLRQRDVVSFDLPRAARLAASAGRYLWTAALRLAGRRSTLLAEAAEAESGMPPGLFSLEPYRRFLARALRDAGLSDDFRRLRKPLLIPATDLDSGRRVVFGEPPWDETSISSAVAASSAIPVFFEPVEVRGRFFVDGNVGKVAHLDLAIARGAEAVLVLNPLVPFANDPDCCTVPVRGALARSLRDRGFFTVRNQSFRVENHVRLHLGVARFTAEHPGLRVLLVEPDRSDTTLFLENPMSWGARRRVLETSYARAREQLASRAEEYEAFFAGQGAPLPQREGEQRRA